VLGPFAWALCVFSTLLFTRRRLGARRAHDAKAEREVTVLYDPRSAAALLACRVLARLRSLRARAGSRRPATSSTGSPCATRRARCTTAPTPSRDRACAARVGPGFAWLFRLPPGVAARSSRAASLRGGAHVALVRALAARSSSSSAPPPSRLRAGSAVSGDGLRELLVAMFFAGAVNQALVELWVVKRRMEGRPARGDARLLAQAPLPPGLVHVLAEPRDGRRHDRRRRDHDRRPPHRSVLERAAELRSPEREELRLQPDLERLLQPHALRRATAGTATR
jgi:hypothetical protein